MSLWKVPEVDSGERAGGGASGYDVSLRVDGLRVGQDSQPDGDCLGEERKLERGKEAHVDSGEAYPMFSGEGRRLWEGMEAGLMRRWYI